MSRDIFVTCSAITEWFQMKLLIHGTYITTHDIGHFDEETVYIQCPPTPDEVSVTRLYTLMGDGAITALTAHIAHIVCSIKNGGDNGEFPVQEKKLPLLETLGRGPLLGAGSNDSAAGDINGSEKLPFSAGHGLSHRPYGKQIC